MKNSLKFIKKVIDDCDYYIIILAARYGSSISPNGISYIEKEHDYAVSQKIPVLAFLHGSPGSIAADKTELSPDARDRLSQFRDKVRTGRMVREWETAKDLRAEVALSLPQTIKVHPAPGWIRGNIAASPEINTLRQENTRLSAKLEQLQNQPMFDNLSQGQDKITLTGWFVHSQDRTRWNDTLSWDEMFSILGPKITNPRLRVPVKNDLDSAFRTRFEITRNTAYRLFWICEQDFETIGIQFSALKLISITSGSMHGGPTGLTREGTEEELWQITEAGRRHLHEIKAIRKQTYP
jgi:hypothetical protein